tara:strand:- start:478 stop:684 length:207 start_codon:yes stop_codon:yes gene_type:complete
MNSIKNIINKKNKILNLNNIFFIIVLLTILLLICILNYNNNKIIEANIDEKIKKTISDAETTNTTLNG